jgi:predicted N-acetyltransferase YhbS
MYTERLARTVLAERASDQVTAQTVCVDGTALTIRPIDITDVDRLDRMARRLSPESIYFRFHAPLRRVPWSALLWLSDVDHFRRDALVALDGDEIVAVARYAHVSVASGSESRDAEIAVTVQDSWQRRGLGCLLARRLCAVALERGFDAFRVTILPDNRVAMGLMRKLVPDASVRFTGGTCEARLPLRDADPAERRPVTCPPRPR